MSPRDRVRQQIEQLLPSVFCLVAECGPGEQAEVQVGAYKVRRDIYGLVRVHEHGPGVANEPVVMAQLHWFSDGTTRPVIEHITDDWYRVSELVDELGRELVLYRLAQLG